MDARTDEGDSKAFHNGVGPPCAIVNSRTRHVTRPTYIVHVELCPDNQDGICSRWIGC